MTTTATIPAHRLPDACYVCGHDAHADATATGGHRYWPNVEAEAELAAEARRQGPPVYSSGARNAEAAYVAAHRPY